MTLRVFDILLQTVKLVTNSLYKSFEIVVWMSQARVLFYLWSRKYHFTQGILSNMARWCRGISFFIQAVLSDYIEYYWEIFQRYHGNYSERIIPLIKRINSPYEASSITYFNFRSGNFYIQIVLVPLFRWY